MKRVAVLVLSLLAAAATGLAAAPPAAAHAALVGTDPTDGSRPAATPGQVRLTFSEDVDPRFAVVAVSHEGRQLDTTSQVSGAEVTVALPSGSAAGSYDVAFRVVSRDGHPVVGRVGFVSDGPATGSATPAATAPTSTDRSPGATAAGAPSTRDLEGSGIASAVGWVIGGLVLVVVLVVLTVALAALRQRRTGGRS